MPLFSKLLGWITILLAYIKDTFRLSTDFWKDISYKVLKTPSISTPE